MGNSKTIAFLPVNRRGAGLTNLLMAGLEAEFFGRTAEEIHATILRYEAMDTNSIGVYYRYYADMRSLALRLNPSVENGGLAFYLPTSASASLKKVQRVRIYLKITKQLGPPQIAWSWPDRLIRNRVDLAELQPIQFAEERNGYTFYHYLSGDTDILVYLDCGEEKLLARVKFRWAKVGINVHLELVSKQREEIEHFRTVIGPVPIELPRRLRAMREWNEKLDKERAIDLPVV